MLPRSDAVIETPADAGFTQTDDGRWVFADPDPGAQWTAELLPDGRLEFDDHLVPRFDGKKGGVVMPGLKELVPAMQGVKFWIKRKRRLLNATQEMRLKMAVQFARDNIDKQLKRLHRDLIAIWTSDEPPHTRRGLLFEAWDDCDERISIDLPGFSDRNTEIDELRVSAGEKARAQILAFIRRHLPADSSDAYTAAELRTLNAKRVSKARFAPYATG